MPREEEEVELGAKSDSGPGPTALISAVVCASLTVGYITVALRRLFTSEDPLTASILTNNFPSVVGLPMAAVGSFIIIVLLRQTNRGPIEFEGLAFKFRGASGPVVLWVVCFAVISIAIRMLWKE